MSAIEIRTYASTDRPALLQALIELQNFEVPLHDTRLPGETTAQPYLERMLREVEAGDPRLQPIRLRQGHLRRAAPSRPGVAQELLAAAQRHLETTGVTRLRLNVLANNLTARRAYERYGFEPYEMLYEKRIGAGR